MGLIGIPEEPLGYKFTTERGQDDSPGIRMDTDLPSSLVSVKQDTPAASEKPEPLPITTDEPEGVRAELVKPGAKTDTARRRKIQTLVDFARSNGAADAEIEAALTKMFGQAATDLMPEGGLTKKSSYGKFKEKVQEFEDMKAPSPWELLTEDRPRDENYAKAAAAVKLNSVSRPWLAARGFLSEDAAKEYQEAVAKDAEQIVASGLKAGVTITPGENGDYSYIDKNGLTQPLSSGLLRDILKSVEESPIANLASVDAAVQVNRALPPSLTPVARFAATTAAMIGGYMFGDATDNILLSLEQNQSLSAAKVAEQAMGNAEFGATLAILGKAAGTPTLAISKYAWGKIQLAHQFVTKSKQNSKALEALLEATGSTREKCEQLILSWESMSQKAVAGKDFNEKAINIALQSLPEGGTLVQAAGHANPKIVTRAVAAAEKRSKEIQVMGQELEGKEFGTELLDHVKKYIKKTKEDFGAVQKAGYELVPEKFSFDFSEGPLEKAFVALAGHPDPTKASIYKEGVAEVEAVLKGGSFWELTELRKKLNSFKYAPASKQKPVYDAINATLMEVDNAIKTAVSGREGGQAWLKDWARKNADYTTYKKFSKNVVFKKMAKKGTDPKDVAKTLVGYNRTIDDALFDVNSYDEFLKNPGFTPRQIEQIDGAIINELIEKHTARNSREVEIINFPRLVKEMRTYKFRSIAGRERFELIDEYVETFFRNDATMAHLTGYVSTPSTNGGFSKNPISMAQFQIMRALFQEMKDVVMNTPGNRRRALYKSINKLVDNPLNPRPAEEVLALMKDPNMAMQIQNLQRAAAAEIGGASPSLSAANQAAQESIGGTVSNPARKSVQMYLHNGVNYWKPPPGVKPKKIENLNYRTFTGGHTFYEGKIPSHRVLQEADAITVLGDGIDIGKMSLKEKSVLLGRGFLSVLREDGRVVNLWQ